MPRKQIAAFKEDCQELINKFLAKKSFKFEDFASVWREMKFSYVFFGQRPLGLIRQFTEEALIIAKYYWLKPQDLPESIAGLYLLYGIYFKNRLQGLIQIPVTLDEMKIVDNFAMNVTDTSYRDCAFIMQKLFDSEAFNFCACAKTYGMEKPYRLQTYNSNHLPKLATFSNDYSELKEFIPLYDQYVESKREIAGIVEDLSLSKTFISEITPDFKCLPGLSSNILNVSKNKASTSQTQTLDRILPMNKRKKANKDLSDPSTSVVLDFPKSIGDNESNETFIIRNDESVNLVNTLGECDVAQKGKKRTKHSENKSVMSRCAKVKSDSVEESKIHTDEFYDMFTLDSSSSHSLEELSQKSYGSEFSWIFRDDNDFE